MEASQVRGRVKESFVRSDRTSSAFTALSLRTFRCARNNRQRSPLRSLVTESRKPTFFVTFLNGRKNPSSCAESNSEEKVKEILTWDESILSSSLYTTLRQYTSEPLLQKNSEISYLKQSLSHYCTYVGSKLCLQQIEQKSIQKQVQAISPSFKLTDCAYNIGITSSYHYRLSLRRKTLRAIFYQELQLVSPSLERAEWRTVSLGTAESPQQILHVERFGRLRVMLYKDQCCNNSKITVPPQPKENPAALSWPSVVIISIHSPVVTL